jgi:DNA repair photolyase
LKITEIKCVEPLKKLKNPHLPYQYDLNIYRGCSHDCKYCYARGSHKYLDGEFESDIYVKVNIAEKLDEILSSPKWDGSRINIGGVCDSYQHAEKKYEITRSVLKVLIKHKNPFTLSTKSDLILRDIDLIKEAVGKFDFNIAICISCIDEDLSKVLEVGSFIPSKKI